MNVRNLRSLPTLRYLVLCNVLHICNVWAIPTYRVYRLYNIYIYSYNATYACYIIVFMHAILVQHHLCSGQGGCPVLWLSVYARTSC